jgi:hypothetical protein
MANQSVSIVDNVAKLALDPSAKQHTIPKGRAKHRMIYGFTFSTDELEEWGRQQFGSTDDEKVLESYLVRSMGPLYIRSRHLWKRTTKHFVTYKRGPRRHESDWCLTLADNISSDTVTPPPREIIDKMKEALQITRDPQWHRFDGD